MSQCGGWAVLETLGSLIDWLIKNECQFSSVSRMCLPGISDYILVGSDRFDVYI